MLFEKECLFADIDSLKKLILPSPGILLFVKQLRNGEDIKFEDNQDKIKTLMTDFNDKIKRKKQENVFS